MARNRAMSGAGSKKMGGLGAKPAAPRTAMAGKPVGGPPGLGGAGGLGAPPKPPAPRPPAGPPLGGGAGAPPPMPGGTPVGGGGGMGGSGGFAAGGAIPEAEQTRYAKGGSVGSDAKGRVGRDTGSAGKSK